MQDCARVSSGPDTSVMGSDRVHIRRSEAPAACGSITAATAASGHGGGATPHHAVYSERTHGAACVALGAVTGVVLDQLAAWAVPVGAEFFGKARDLRRRVAHEDAKFFPAINRLIAPIDARLRKFPERRQDAAGNAGRSDPVMALPGLPRFPPEPRCQA